MENIFISDITIECVRHLKNITIPLSDGREKAFDSYRQKRKRKDECTGGAV